MHAWNHFSSINAINALSKCAIAVPSTSYPFVTHHPSLKESVIAALMTLQLNTNMKVWLNSLEVTIVNSDPRHF